MSKDVIEEIEYRIKCLDEFPKAYEELCNIADTGKTANSNEHPELFKWVDLFFSKDWPGEKHQPYYSVLRWKSENPHLESHGFYGHIENNSADSHYLLGHVDGRTYCFEKVKKFSHCWWCGCRILESICEAKKKFYKKKLVEAKNSSPEEIENLKNTVYKLLRNSYIVSATSTKD